MSSLAEMVSGLLKQAYIKQGSIAIGIRVHSNIGTFLQVHGLYTYMSIVNNKLPVIQSLTVYSVNGPRL
jgi:hypothetical protein